VFGHTDFSQTKIVARKQFKTVENFKLEDQTLQGLRSNLAEHRRIITSLATIIQSFASGTVYNMLYELAAFDLRQFFHGPDHQDGYQQYYSENPTHFESWKAVDLIRETMKLADALDFLHRRLVADGTIVECVHNDLKPVSLTLCVIM
jgi:serine/threonine protein kinase